MKERDIKNFGFAKTKVSKKESGTVSFYYYTWEPYAFSNFFLISCTSDEAEKIGFWWVEVFDTSVIKIVDKKHVKMIITAIEESMENKKLLEIAVLNLEED